MVSNGQNIATTTAAEITATPIPVSLLTPSPLNRKCDDTDADIAELAQTIAESGLINPISARPMDGGNYEIICGERRWRAFRLLECETIPCFIKHLDDTQAQIERIVENYQRRDPSFMEQGEAVAALMQLTDRDVSEVANRLGQSVSWVRRRAKLPNLIPAWREELAKKETPYFAIRDSVSKMEEVALLPAATQKIILDSGVLRYLKTTKEIRNTIAKHFMNLDAKPWTRAWEKKAFSGSGKKRCDACMKRSDRENALFADPNDANSGKKMCLDPECWKSKCLAWCRSLMDDTPGMVPIRQGYGYGTDNLTEYFGVKPVSYYEWEERDETEAREGYAEAVGVFVDGVDIGTTKPIWLELPDEDDATSDDDNDISDVHNWRQSSTNRYQTRAALAGLIQADITAYLADIAINATIPAAQLTQNKIRACFWFGVYGAASEDDPEIRIDDPAWNPIATAWERVSENAAEFIAALVAEDIAQLYNGDRDNATDATNVAALVAMFEIPLDVITTRATEELHKATSDEQDSGSQDDTGEMNDDDLEDSPDTAAPMIDVAAEDLTDPDDVIQLDSVSFLRTLADAQ